MYVCTHSDAGSTASSGSETENQSLHAGVCVRQSRVSGKDANIAKEALELLVICLQLRSHLLSESLLLYLVLCISVPGESVFSSTHKDQSLQLL